MRQLLKILLSWIASLAVLYLVSSWLFFRWATLLFPFSVTFHYLFENMGDNVALQYSRSGAVPENYVAILGDSYAFGQGDGLTQLQGSMRPAYNVTHFIHESTGKDVVSFGIPSSSSLKAYVEDPVSQLRFANKSFITRIAKPASIVLYFYEGNDIEENFQEIRERLVPQGYDKSRLQDYSYFRDMVHRNIVEKNSLYRDERPAWEIDGLRVFHFLRTAARFVFMHEGFSGKYKEIESHDAHAGAVNKVWMAGKVVAVPDGFQGPSMLIDASQTDEGFAVLEHAVHVVRDTFPGVPVALVYIPSPATVYRFASTDIDLWDMINNPDERPHRPTAEIRPRSNMFCRRVMEVARKNAVFFHDARPVILEHGSREFLHGPVDWHHFNLQGYRVLSGEVQKAVTALEHGNDAGLSACTDL